ncbi:hypothetical protein FQA39_LY02453 [Lamprigera yunnana]|nr:hypothetical protein FQA39_LY02453 [Lamprigera yunnana]
MVFADIHNIFIVEAYFRSGIMTERGVWDYSYQNCYEQFHQEYPDLDFTYNTFIQHVRQLIHRFRETETIKKGKSADCPTVLSEEVLEDVQERMDASPRKSLRHLSAQTGLSLGTYQKALKELLPADFGRQMHYCEWFNNLIDYNVLNLTV